MNSQSFPLQVPTEPTPDQRPRGALRAKYWSSWYTLIFLLIVFAFPGQKKPLDSTYLALYSVIALMLASYECRQMWRLKAKRMPRWLGLTLGILVSLTTFALLIIDDMGVFVWNSRYLQMPFLLFNVVVACVAWIVEWRKSVDIYWTLEGTIFVPQTSNAGVRHRVFAVILFCFAAETGFILFHEEPLDTGLEAFYFPNCLDVPDSANGAIGLLGLSAPQGADFMAHGRFVADTLEESLESEEMRKKIASKGTLFLTAKPGELDCVAWPVPDTPQGACPSVERLTMLLMENAELLERYRQISLLPQFHLPHYGYNAQLFLDINKLVAESVALELHKGDVETAYRKWRDNYVFLSKMAHSEATWKDKVVLLWAEKLSLGSAETLLYSAPGLVQTHGDELIQLLQPVDLSRWNLEGALRAEYRLIDSVISGEGTQAWVHPNFIRNRHFRAASVFMQTITGRLPELKANLRAVVRQHTDLGVWTWDYVRNPMNTYFARQYSPTVRTESLVSAMIHLVGRMRLLSLRLLIARNKVADTDMVDFLSKQPSEFRNPFNDASMEWDPVKREIFFCQPDSEKQCGRVRLPVVQRRPQV